MYFSGNPYEHIWWIEEKIGPRMLEIIWEKSLETYHGWKLDLGNISKHYRSELAKMEALRNEGVTGRIEFTGWN